MIKNAYASKYSYHSYGMKEKSHAPSTICRTNDPEVRGERETNVDDSEAKDIAHEKLRRNVDHGQARKGIGDAQTKADCDDGRARKNVGDTEASAHG